MLTLPSHNDFCAAFLGPELVPATLHQKQIYTNQPWCPEWDRSEIKLDIVRHSGNIPSQTRAEWLQLTKVTTAGHFIYQKTYKDSISLEMRSEWNNEQLCLTLSCSPLTWEQEPLQRKCKLKLQILWQHTLFVPMFMHYSVEYGSVMISTPLLIHQRFRKYTPHSTKMSLRMAVFIEYKWSQLKRCYTNIYKKNNLRMMDVLMLVRTEVDDEMNE